MERVHVRMVFGMMVVPGVPHALLNAILAILVEHVPHVIRTELAVTTIFPLVHVNQDTLNKVTKVIVKLVTGNALLVLQQDLVHVNHVIVLPNTDGLMQPVTNACAKMVIMMMEQIFANNVIILVSPAGVLRRLIVNPAT